VNEIGDARLESKQRLFQKLNNRQEAKGCFRRSGGPRSLMTRGGISRPLCGRRPWPRRRRRSGCVRRGFPGVLPIIVGPFFWVRKNLVSLVNGLGSLLSDSLLAR